MLQGWVPLFGNFTEHGDELFFHGGLIPGPNAEVAMRAASGLALVPLQFVGGRVSATIEFTNFAASSGCELVLYHDPGSNAMVTAGFMPGSSPLYGIRHWDTQRWNIYRSSGERAFLKEGQGYHLAADVSGSRVVLWVNGVQVLTVDLPIALFESHIGVLCESPSAVTIRDFEAEVFRAKAFVVMQFSSPYNELYEEVIRKVGEDVGLDVIRADEELGPGIIISDIAGKIAESTVIIADISPANPNVYYEVGYAHALNKPTILLAETPNKLPFDLAPHRVLFYENTIAGKTKLENSLRSHLETILREPASFTIPPSTAVG